MYMTELLLIFMTLFQLMSILEMFSIDDGSWKTKHHKGRFTRDVKEYEVMVPSKLSPEGKFLSYSLPHFYKRDIVRVRERRSTDDANDMVHYGLAIGEHEYMVELYPNRGLMSPGLMVEKRSGGSLQDTNIHPASSEQCHYTGWIRGNRNTSRAAISVCQSGMVGYVKTSDGRRHFIEPVSDHQPESDGRHLHLVYEDSQESRHRRNCGTGDDWERAWRERLMKEYKRNIRPESSLKRDVEQRLERIRQVLRHPEKKRTVHSEHRYLEILVVADKRFVEYHSNPDREDYILTIMNMANDFYHDASVGNLIDFVVVRIMYLEKEEEEIDLVINRDAESTLSSFCKWQFKVNPKDISHPNHHDIAVLLTRYDICSDNVTQCGLLGLANTATACDTSHSCCINEDAGLSLGVVVTHEVGHVMGCAHDEIDSSGCEPYSDPEKHFAHVMSPYVQLATNKWSTCSRGFITELAESDLGSCLLDEPQEHLFKLPNMPPGAMYDIEWQCRQKFGPNSKSCKRGPKETCEKLWCTMGETEKCGTYGSPPADGTKCGENMWCFERHCVDIGSRPAAVDGGWAEWGPYTECSRTCGAGVSVSERDCTNPAPQNHGRYCTGEKKRYRICNTTPCDMKEPSYRESQCAGYNNKPFRDKLHRWKPYEGGSETPCKLVCCNENSECRVLSPRAADGTPCKPGTKDMCIAGSCHKVGCDWVMDSGAVEDQCGICNGDGNGCEIVEGTYTKQGGNDYEKIITIPAEARKIFVEEVEPSPNTIAVTDESGKNFYLNGDYREETDGDRRIAGSVSIYTHPEPDKEMLVINGPLENSINLYVCFFDDANPGVTYKYALLTKSEGTLGTEEAKVPDVEIPGEDSQTQSTEGSLSIDIPFMTSTVASEINSQVIHSKNTVEDESIGQESKYSWEFLEWEECSVKCGGGVQMSDPSCVEDRNGRVSDSYCKHLTKPEPMTRICNPNPCKAYWKIGAWSHCQGCLYQTGCRMRSVNCVKQSPSQDLEVITDDKECQGKKPITMELCTPIKICHRNKSQVHSASHKTTVKPTEAFTKLKANTKTSHLTETPALNNHRKERNILHITLHFGANDNLNNYKTKDMHTKLTHNSEIINNNELINSYKPTSKYDRKSPLLEVLPLKRESGIAASGEEVSIVSDQSYAENENDMAKAHRMILNVPLHVTEEYIRQINNRMNADLAAYRWMLFNQPLNTLSRYNSRGSNSQKQRYSADSKLSANKIQSLHANSMAKKRYYRRLKSNPTKHKNKNGYKTHSKYLKRHISRDRKENTSKRRFKSTSEGNVQSSLNKLHMRKQKYISNGLNKEPPLKGSHYMAPIFKQNCDFEDKKDRNPYTHQHKRKSRLVSKKHIANKRHLQKYRQKLTSSLINNREYTTNDINTYSNAKECKIDTEVPKVTINKADIGKIAIDRVPERDFQLEEAPMIEETKKLALSDEASEILGDMVPDIINTKNATYLKGKQTEEVEKHLTHGENGRKRNEK